MGLNKQILQKVKEKTGSDMRMQKFILNILEGESNGKGWQNKYYKAEIENAIKGGQE